MAVVPVFMCVNQAMVLAESRKTGQTALNMCISTANIPNARNISFNDDSVDYVIQQYPENLSKAASNIPLASCSTQLIIK